MSDPSVTEASLPARFSTPTRRLVAGATLVGQAWVLFAPSTPDTGVPVGWHLDKVVHFGIFGAATYAVIWAGGRPRVVVPAMLAYAAASEVVQHNWLPNRAGDPFDLLADVLGVGAGLAAWWLTRRSRSAG